jgi:hypothetical protein
LFGAVKPQAWLRDTVHGTAGKTVTVTTGTLLSCGVPILVMYDGILEFTNGNKLDLPATLLVIIMQAGS